MNKKGSPRSWFNKWSNDYDSTLGSIGFHRELLKLAVRKSGVKNSDKILDIGCGTGLLSLQFLRKADCHITAFDSSKDMLALFKKKINELGLERNVGCRLSDIESFTAKPDSFDIAAGTVVLHHLKSKVPQLRKICRMLKPGGRLIIGEVDMDASGSHTDPVRLKRIIRALEEEWVAAIQEVGIEAFAKMYENGMKHILNEGEYCASLKQWAGFCREAGFKKVTIYHVNRYPSFGVVVAVRR